MRAHESEWYRLDNTAKIFPSIASAKMPTIYRISSILKEPIRIAELQQAVANILPRFPYFQVYLRKGLFWYYYDRTKDIPKIFPDSKFPCEHIRWGEGKIFPFRLRAFRNRLHMETSHIITDGTGCIAFLKALTAEYLNMVHGPFTDFGDIIRPDTPVDPEESEDAFLKHYRKGSPPPRPLTKAFHLPFPRVYFKEYYITTGIASLDVLKRIAKENNATINDLLTAILFDAFQEFYFSLPEKQRIKANPLMRFIVPINLRTIFPHKTLRNFTLYSSPELDMRFGRYDFDEILNVVHHTVRLDATPKGVARDLTRNVDSEINPLIRIVPRVIKDIVMSQVFNSIGEVTNTSSISNLGRQTMPEAMAQYIEGFNFIPAPGPQTKCNCGIVGFGDTVRISFGRIVKETVIEMYFFRKLRKLGVPIRIETN